MFLLLATVFLLVLYAVLIFFYYHHWNRLPLYQCPEKMPQLRLSVVIAARNEARNLPCLMKALAGQTYPSHLFEIVVVDDFSTDNTETVMRPFLNSRVRMVSPDTSAEESSKKKAVDMGIRTAIHDFIVITDADCKPGSRWLQTIAAFATEHDASFIAAPVQFMHNKSLLQVFQAIDFLTLQGITAASVSARFHSMCNGANLAYKKSSFLAAGGFEGIDHIASGDDMLLMHKIRRLEPEKVWYVKSTDAVMATQPMPGWRQLLQQRRRWASKSGDYEEGWIKAVLFFVYIFNCWFVVLLLSAFVTGHSQPVILFLVLKTAIEWPFVWSVARFYGEQGLMSWFPLLQPLHMVFVVVVGLSSQVGRYEWKGRKTK